MKRTRNDIRKKQIGSERKYENGRQRGNNIPIIGVLDIKIKKLSRANISNF